MVSICGINCDECNFKENCNGCSGTEGCPFGKKCFIAEYIKLGGIDNYILFKNKVIDEINQLNIEGLPKLKELYPLVGSFVNVEYPLPNSKCIKFLDDNSIYLGNQLECEFNDEDNKKCFGVVADLNNIIVCEYGENCENPQLLLFKKR